VHKGELTAKSFSKFSEVVQESIDYIASSPYKNHTTAAHVLVRAPCVPANFGDYATW